MAGAHGCAESVRSGGLTLLQPVSDTGRKREPRSQTKVSLYRSPREPGGSVLHCERCGRVMAVRPAFHLFRGLASTDGRHDVFGGESQALL